MQCLCLGSNLLGGVKLKILSSLLGLSLVIGFVSGCSFENSHLGKASEDSSAAAPEQTSAQLVISNAAASALSGLELVQASNAQPVSGYDPILNAASIYLASLPTQKISIYAIPASSAKIGSIFFSLDGGSYSHIENFAPYALCGDNTACPQIIKPGSHSLTATAYSAAAKGGSVIGTISISFSVYSDKAPLKGFSLVAASNAAPISGFSPLANGATITLSSLSTKNLSIFATPSGSDTIGSVFFH